MASRHPESELREPLPAEGVPIPLLATFAGLAGVPLLSLGKNNLSALLRLLEAKGAPLSPAARNLVRDSG